MTVGYIPTTKEPISGVSPECFLVGKNSVVINQATMNRMIEYMLKRFSNVHSDAQVYFDRMEDASFRFSIKREAHDENA